MSALEISNPAPESLQSVYLLSIFFSSADFPDAQSQPGSTMTAPTVDRKDGCANFATGLTNVRKKQRERIAQQVRGM